MWSTHFSALLFALGDAAWLCVCALDLTENSKNFSTFDYHLDDDGAWHVLLQLANCSTLFFSLSCHLVLVWRHLVRFQVDGEIRFWKIQSEV